VQRQSPSNWLVVARPVPVSSPRRELLELLAFGRDPDVRPAERLRALELLEQMTEEDDRALAFAREAATMDEATVRAWEDAFFANLIARISDDEKQALAEYPGIAAALSRAVDERAREIESARRAASAVYDSVPITETREEPTEALPQPGLRLVSD
jgi:hypothetical protein